MIRIEYRSKKEEEEFELLGRQLNEIYLKSKLRFKISENENKCSCDNLLCLMGFFDTVLNI
jgi:hypothetical protein